MGPRPAGADSRRPPWVAGDLLVQPGSFGGIGGAAIAAGPSSNGQLGVDGTLVESCASALSLGPRTDPDGDGSKRGRVWR